MAEDHQQALTVTDGNFFLIFSTSLDAFLACISDCLFAAKEMENHNLKQTWNNTASHLLIKRPILGLRNEIKY